MKFAPLEPKLGIYIHWPYCARLCPYCDFNIYRARAQDFDGLVNAIISEIFYWRGEINTKKLSSIFFGGGTPSLMRPEQVSKILAACDQAFGIENDAEISLEANPNDFVNFKEFKLAGVNRLSLGVQSFDDENLKFLGRFHDAKLARQACEQARKTFENFSLDLIYALPNQSLESWESDLSQALNFTPNHVSPYQLTIEENTAFDRKRKRGQIIEPKDDICAELYDFTGSFLKEGGLEKYEISNHARSANSQSKHNLIYWQSQNWLGIGPGSHGRIWQNGRRATLNISRPENYVQAIKQKGNALESDEILSTAEAFQEYLIMGLRVSTGINYSKACEFINENALREMCEMGFVNKNGDILTLTAVGQKLSNTIISKLLGSKS